jgi:hypothetical protein
VCVCVCVVCCCVCVCNMCVCVFVYVSARARERERERERERGSGDLPVDSQKKCGLLKFEGQKKMNYSTIRDCCWTLTGEQNMSAPICTYIFRGGRE